MQLSKTLCSCCFALLLFLVSCKENTTESILDAATETEASDQLGVIDIQFTGAESAMPAFTKGLLLLHNFEYEDSRTAFLEAQELDSTFLMAYWGEAMTYNHPLWRQQDYEKGQAALLKIGADPQIRAEKAATALEKDFLHAVEILYGEGKKKERDQLYSDYLAALYKQYPGNQEIAAFYALSCLGAVPVGRDNAAYEKGASIAKNIIKTNPSHPGALHYLIHSYDDPDHAALALGAANSYSKVAADAAHALHMPSHIYVAVGMWDEVVNCNIASWNASVKRMEEKGLDENARSFHAMHWRMYGHLQKGQFEKAANLIKEMDDYIQDESEKRTRTYHPWMRANYLVETGDWDGPYVDLTTKTDDLNIRSQAVLDYIKGMKAYRKGDKKEMGAILKAMAKRRTIAETLVTEEGTPMCSAAGANRYAPNRTDIDQAHIIEMELQALRYWKDEKVAEDWLQKAVQLETATSYAYGPPRVVQPTHELYGQWLLENDQAKTAQIQFEKALERGPNRINAMKGLLTCYQKLDKKEAAAELSKKLNAILKDADIAGKMLLEKGKTLSAI